MIYGLEYSNIIIYYQIILNDSNVFATNEDGNLVSMISAELTK